MKKYILIALSVMASMKVTSAQELEVATFENLGLPDNSYWCGDLAEEDEDLGLSYNSFVSGSFEFNNLYWPDYNSWAFFGYSSRTEKDFVNYNTDQFNSITGTGANNSATFGIAFPAAYMGNTVMTVGDGVTPSVIPGMQIVNTVWVVDCILNGDGMSARFGKGDWLKLILTGYVGDEPTQTCEYYLADYTSNVPTNRYYLNQWTWIDLSLLGPVTSVRFNIDSSKSNAYGITTPTYACIDNVGCVKPEAAVENVVSDGLALQFIAESRHLAVSGIKDSARFLVAEISGKIVMCGELSAPAESIDLSGLVSGLYVVTISDATSSDTKKIVIR